MNKTILHVDLNNFYASVECLFNPALKGVPVAVCGSSELRHGIVLAKNDIAKKMGVKTGDVIWEAKKKCPNIKIVSPPNFELYLKFSRMAREIYARYSDKIESFGIDECWIDVTESTNLFGSGVDIAEKIRQEIKTELGVTVSIGVSYNKIFAKLGSDYKKPDAITVISEDNFKKIVWPLKASELLYVGKSTYKKLEKVGIITIGDMANAGEKVLKELLGKWGEYLYVYANGLDNTEVTKNTASSIIKSVGNSTTVDHDLTNMQEVDMVLGVLSESVGARLREYGLKGSCVGVYVKDNLLNTSSFQSEINYKTWSTTDINNKATLLFKEKYKFVLPIRALGVRVTNLVDGGNSVRQLDLFGDADKEDKRNKLDIVLDKLRARYGYHVIKKAKMILDSSLTELNAKEENTIHPIAFKK